MFRERGGNIGPVLDINDVFSDVIYGSTSQHNNPEMFIKSSCGDVVIRERGGNIGPVLDINDVFGDMLYMVAPHSTITLRCSSRVVVEML